MKTLKYYPVPHLRMVNTPRHDVATTNKVLASSQLLLSITLLFGASTAAVSLARDLPHPGLLASVVGYLVLSALVSRLRHNEFGLGAAFALSGFVGYTLGPLLSHYVGLPNGSEVTMTALAGSAVAFLGLSVYTLSCRKAFRFNDALAASGSLIALATALGMLFSALPYVAAGAAGAMALLISGMFLAVTSNIIYRTRRNYVLGTVTLFASLIDLIASPIRMFRSRKDA